MPSEKIDKKIEKKIKLDSNNTKIIETFNK